MLLVELFHAGVLFHLQVESALDLVFCLARLLTLLDAPCRRLYRPQRVRVAHVLLLLGDRIGFVALGDLLAPDLVVDALLLAPVLLLLAFLALKKRDLVIEFLLLTDEGLDFLGEAVLDETDLVILALVEQRVLLQQVEGVYTLLGDARSQVLRRDVCIVQLFKLVVPQSLESIRHVRWLHILIEHAVSMRLLPCTFVERDRRQTETLLFCPVKDVLVQSFLLLRDQLFLECQLVRQLAIVHERLLEEVVHCVSDDLIVLLLELLLAFGILALEAARDSIQVVAGVAAQDRMLRVDTVMADQCLLRCVPRHASIVLTHAVANQIHLVLVEGRSCHR